MITKALLHSIPLNVTRVSSVPFAWWWWCWSMIIKGRQATASKGRTTTGGGGETLSRIVIIRQRNGGPIYQHRMWRRLMMSMLCCRPRYDRLAIAIQSEDGEIFDRTSTETAYNPPARQPDPSTMARSSLLIVNVARCRSYQRSEILDRGG